MKEEIKEFLRGFYSVIPLKVISVFDLDELDFIMSGIPEIDIDDWRNNT